MRWSVSEMALFRLRMATLPTLLISSDSPDSSLIILISGGTCRITTTSPIVISNVAFVAASVTQQPSPCAGLDRITVYLFAPSAALTQNLVGGTFKNRLED